MKQLRLVVPFLSVVLLAACSLPFGGGGEPAEEAVGERPPGEGTPAEQSSIDEPTRAIEPTEAALGSPILHLESGRQIQVTHIQMVSDDLGWAIGGLQGPSDHVFRTNDGGSHWQDVTPPEPRAELGQPAKIAVGSFVNAQNGWVLYYPDTIEPLQMGLRVWATQDAGESWSASDPFDLEFLGTSEYPPQLGFQDTENGWLLARHGPAGMHRYPIYLLRTTDGGLSWAPLITPAEGGLQSCRKSALQFVDNNVGWASLADCPETAPQLAVTVDGGRNWRSMPLPAPVNRPELFDTEICEGHSPQLINPLDGALAVSCATGLKLNLVYITHDGGSTWSSHLYPGGDLILLNQRTAYAYGNQKIYQSVDGGQNWEWVKTVEWDGQFSFVSDLVGWAVARTGEAIALVNTTNGARTWGLLKPLIAP